MRRFGTFLRHLSSSTDALQALRASTLVSVMLRLCTITFFFSASRESNSSHFLFSICFHFQKLMQADIPSIASHGVVHLNAAGSSPVPTPVLNTVIQWMQGTMCLCVWDWGDIFWMQGTMCLCVYVCWRTFLVLLVDEQRIGGYGVAAQKSIQIDSVYKSIQNFVNAESTENIALVFFA